MVKYTVVNPFMVGKFETTYEGSDAMDAAQKFWTKFSTKLTNNLPLFSFTIKDIKTDKLHHFDVKEQMTGGGVKTELTEKALVLSSSAVNKLNEEVSRLNKQYGGRKSNDDSSSSEDTDYKIIKKFNKLNKLNFPQPYGPIVYFKYFPGLYGMEDIYIPTFIAPVIPYIELNFSTAFWG